MGILDRTVPRRILYLSLLSLGVAGLVLAASRGQPGTDGLVDRDPVVQALVPSPDSDVLRQSSVGIHLAFGYTASLTLNDVRIPDEELSGNTELGQFYFQPGQGRAVETLNGGRNCVVATYWQVVQGPATAQSTRWCFAAA